MVLKSMPVLELKAWGRASGMLMKESSPGGCAAQLLGCERCIISQHWL